MKIINLMPYDIEVHMGGNVIERFPSQYNGGRYFRTEEVDSIITDEGNEIPILQRKVVETLPPEEKGTMYIVPEITARIYKDRHDLLIQSEVECYPDENLVWCRTLGKL